MLSISTCWNSGRHKDGEEMLQELLDLGFDRVELGHGIRLSLMEGVMRMFQRGKVRFSSLHNFCPLPIEIPHASPDCYMFSSPDARERDRALKHTYQTIDFAVKLEAQFVVLHLGRAPIDDYTSKLVRLCEVGMGQSRGFVAEKLECIQRREAKVGPYLERSRDALKRVADYAGERGITLGVESRHSFEEIPNEREMLAVLSEFDVPHVGYWHDFGAGLRPLRPLLPDDCAPYVFPLWVETPDPGYQALRRLGFPVSRWDQRWPTIPNIADDQGPLWSHHVLQIACHQDLSEPELQRMLTLIKQIYATGSTPSESAAA